MATSASKPSSFSEEVPSKTPSRKVIFLSCMASLSTKPTRPSQLRASLTGSLPSAMCLRTSSLARLWRVKRTTDFCSSADFSSHSRSTLRLGGSSSALLTVSHSVMAAWGETAVCSSVSDRPGRLLTKLVMMSSALLWLPASVSSSRASRSIQTHTLDWRAKACGSSESRAF